MMKISFLIPTYNDEAYIENSINSILKQRTEYEKEIIVVNDGSNDNTPIILKRLLEENPTLKVIHKINGGVSSALNEGLKHCTGNFIAIVEADTKLEEDWLSLVMQGFDSAEVMGVGGRLTCISDDPWIARLAGYEIEEKFKTKPKYCYHITAANAIYRQEAFKKFGKFDETLVNASNDSDFNSRIINARYKLLYVKEARAKHHFKPTLIQYLKRQYAYAFYRMHVRKLFLYPADKWLGVNLALSSLAFISLGFIPYSPLIPAVMFASAFTFQLPATYRIWREKKDWVLLLYPPVLILRNIVGAGGYAAGLIKKLFSKKKN